jgi:outer membrane receptor protein involved in Fe transport
MRTHPGGATLSSKPTLILGLASILAVGSTLARAEEPSKPLPADADEPVLLPEVQVVGTGAPAPVSTTPRSVGVVDRERIRRTQSGSVPDALLEEVGVFVQKTAGGQGAPILRGLIGKQTLIMVDDVRLNNSTFRAGPNQYLATVDVESVERIEVVRGPSSVLYGSDALGGVLRTISRRQDPLAAGEESILGGRASLRVATHEDSVRLRAEGRWADSRAGVLAGVTLAEFGDVEAGSGTREQPHTGYKERDADVAVRMKLDEKNRLDLSLQHVRQSGIERAQFLVVGWRGTGSTRNLIWEIDSQERDLLAANWHRVVGGPFLRTLDATLSFHRQAEVRHEQRTGSTSKDRFDDAVSTPGLVVRATGLPHRDHDLSYGIEAYRDDVRSDRSRINTATGVPTSYQRGTWAGEANYLSLGAYVQDRWTLRDGLDVTLGARYSRFRIDTDKTDPDPTDAEPIPDISESFDDVTGTVHLRGELGRGWSSFAGVARGFRSPNVEDLTVFQVTSTSFDVPASNLDPETLSQVELGVRHDSDRWAAGITWYRSYIRDLIDRVPTTWNGSTTDGSGRAYTTRGNVGKATIEGVEAEATVLLGGGFSATGQITVTAGRNDDLDEPLSKIPPVFGGLGLRWEERAPRGLFAEVSVLASRHQRRLSSSDLTDTRIPSGGTPGWTVAHFRTGIRITDVSRLELAVENLFNKDYRYHSSGLNAPGRGAVITFSMEW